MKHWNRLPGVVVALCLATALAFIGFGGTTPRSAIAAEDHSPAEHAEKTTALKKAFDGSVDIYFDPKQVDGGAAANAGVRFLDIVDVTGKDLLRFEKANERWLVDPDLVLAFKVVKAK